MASKEKVSWEGTLVSVQPRIRLWRSFDQRGHSYLGYALVVSGTVEGVACEFSVGIGKAAQEKHGFKVGDGVSGKSMPVADDKKEWVDYYKTSGLKLVSLGASPSGNSPPPWVGPPPPLEEYRHRGHRRLDARTYQSRCRPCLWGSRMSVELVIDQWNPSQKRYRIETFCYGPRSCPFYKAGPTRKVPGRNGMTWEEENWIDEDATAHRDPDE